MISDTMNNMRRRAHGGSPQHQARVISPQRPAAVPFNQRISHPISQVIPNSLPNKIVHSPPRNIHQHPFVHQHHGYVATQPIVDPRFMTGVSSVRTSVQNNAIRNKTSQKGLAATTEGFPNVLNRPISDIQQNTIIQSIRTKQVSLNGPEHDIRHDPNIRIIGMHPSNQYSTQSKALTDQFKNNLEKVQQLKSMQQSQQQQQQQQNKTHDAPVPKEQINLNQYILQLLSEASRTKVIITKLIDDNQFFIAENNRLQKLQEEYQLLRKALIPLQLQNADLKEELRIVLRENRENRTSHETNYSDYQQQTLTIVNLQHEIQSLKNIIENSNNPEQFNKILHSKNTQIQELLLENEHLKSQNIDLSLKIKELLIELHKFGNERMALMEESQNFRIAATGEIDRLKGLLQSPQQLNHSPYRLDTVIDERKEHNIYKTVTEVRTPPKYDDNDTRVQISGGYEELILGKTPSPAKILTATTEIVDGVPVSTYDYIQSY